MGVLGGGMQVAGVFTDETRREERSEAGLSVTGVDGGAMTGGLADDSGPGVCVEAETGQGFKKGTDIGTGVFLGLAALFPQSFGCSSLFILLPFLPPLCFSLPLFCSLRASPESLSSLFPFCPASLLPP